MCYVCSKSEKKIFHSADCRYVEGIKKENRIYFKTLKDATNAGYRQCKCCSHIQEYLDRESSRIGGFCKQNGIYYYTDPSDGALNVISKTGNWKIIVNGRYHNIWLYHKSNLGSHDDEFISGYHSQDAYSTSLKGYMKYIVNHDSFKRDKPLSRASAHLNCTEGSRKWKKVQKHAEKARRQQSIKYVLDLIDNMSAGNIAY